MLTDWFAGEVDSRSLSTISRAKTTKERLSYMEGTPRRRLPCLVEAKEMMRSLPRPSGPRKWRLRSENPGKGVGPGARHPEVSAQVNIHTSR